MKSLLLCGIEVMSRIMQETQTTKKSTRSSISLSLCVEQYTHHSTPVSLASVDGFVLGHRWTPMRLLGERTNFASKSCLELKALIPHFTLPGSCSHCGSSLHKGSYNQCPFKKLETSTLAKDAAGRATTKHDNGMGKSLAIAESIKEVQLL
jgi:hypothetical protein